MQVIRNTELDLDGDSPLFGAIYAHSTQHLSDGELTVTQNSASLWLPQTLFNLLAYSL